MPFLCPRCGRPELALLLSLDLPPDARSDEIAVQVLACAACDLRAVGLYEESRRGAGESVNHLAWPRPAGEVEALHAQLARCRTPHDPRCGCPVHRELADERPWERLPGDACSALRLVR